MLGFKSAGVSDVGRVRKANEDSFYVDPKSRFFILADGMGGHKGGKIASAMCIEWVKDHLDSEYESYLTLGQLERKEKLRLHILKTSVAISDRANEDNSLSDMGTTLVVLLRTDFSIMVAHAGDSRAYLLRQNALFQVTQDHSFEQEQVRKGIPLSDAKRSPMRHMLSRNVGLNPPSEPSFTFFTEMPNDIWCLCSDGLSNKVTSLGISKVLQNTELTPEQKAEKLIAMANKHGGEDNITVIIADAFT